MPLALAAEEPPNLRLGSMPLEGGSRPKRPTLCSPEMMESFRASFVLIQEQVVLSSEFRIRFSLFPQTPWPQSATVRGPVEAPGFLSRSLPRSTLHAPTAGHPCAFFGDPFTVPALEAESEMPLQVIHCPRHPDTLQS